MTTLAAVTQPGDPHARPTTHHQQGDTVKANTARKATNLSPPMVELLTDIATKPQMYITRWSPWDRTAQALIRRELAFVSGGSHYRQYELRITDKGRAEATRRGIGADVEPDQHTDRRRP